jgi:hypothetical protein
MASLYILVSNLSIVLGRECNIGGFAYRSSLILSREPNQIEQAQPTLSK